jgi:hypothetical protein
VAAGVPNPLLKSTASSTAFPAVTVCDQVSDAPAEALCAPDAATSNAGDAAAAGGVNSKFLAANI